MVLKVCELPQEADKLIFGKGIECLVPLACIANKPLLGILKASTFVQCIESVDAVD